jgi:hypothetical protein
MKYPTLKQAHDANNVYLPSFPMEEALAYIDGLKIVTQEQRDTVIALRGLIQKGKIVVLDPGDGTKPIFMATQIRSEHLS